MIKTIGYAALSAHSNLAPFTFERRDVGDRDLKIDILYCGICHSDIHTARNQWWETRYPVVPGHEIVGRVAHIGSQVKGFAVGEFVAVGCIVGSCGVCAACKQHLEQFCEQEFTETFNSVDPYTNGVTYGGYSQNIVVNEKYVFHIPDAFKKDTLAAVAPLLCAGITTYSPLKHWKVGKGQKVGVIGIGGLGHLAVKIARALGADVVAITSTQEKLTDAKRLGASSSLLMTDTEGLMKHAESFDFILCTLPVPYDENKFIDLLKRDGVMCVAGIPPRALDGLRADKLILGRKSIAGSLIGGIQETREMLEFCAQHGITADVQLISVDEINEAFDNVVDKKVRYRYVIDMATLK
jgi:uncharacterized zinc-type alcohol dehydrogenase-like protein